MRNVEAVFGGILALIVLGAAIFMVGGGDWGGDWGGGQAQTPTTPAIVTPTTGAGSSAPTSAEDVYCQCFDQAYDLARNGSTLSSEYRAGFESCRAVAGVKGGDAWTAGWNARLSSKPFQANCRAFLRSN